MIVAEEQGGGWIHFTESSRNPESSALWLHHPLGPQSPPRIHCMQKKRLEGWPGESQERFLGARSGSGKDCFPPAFHGSHLTTSKTEKF